MAWLDDVKQIMPPPEQPRAVESQAWASPEAALGAAIPSDYKAFVTEYGPGGMFKFVWFFSPANDNKTLDLQDAARAADSAYAQLKLSSPERFPLPPLPAEGSFLSFALTDNGNYLGWIINGTDPDDWRVAIMDDESGIPEITSMTFSQFLPALVRQEFVPTYFPEDFSELPRAFVAAK